MRSCGAVTGLLALLLALPVTAQEMPAVSAPPQAAAFGYKMRTFSSRFDMDVDTAGSLKPGFKWYFWRFFGQSAKAENVLIGGAEKGVTLLGDTTGPNGQLATAAPVSTSAKFVGSAFGGGGYFEATFKFDPKEVISRGFVGWPSWWSMALEHMAGLDTRQWAGEQAGYEHFIEADIFEYDLKDDVRAGNENYYGGAVHDWYGHPDQGLKKVTLPHFAVVRKAPRGIDFNQYHRYGLLWVPATESRNGFLEYYLDGRPIGLKVEWTKLIDQAPPPRSPWMFGVTDRNHLVLILGTGVGQPMTIESVDVWQSSDENNLRQ